MKNQKGFTLFEVMAVLFIIAAIGGWITNIVVIAHSDFNHIDGMLVIRVIGIFLAPLGAVLGYV